MNLADTEIHFRKPQQLSEAINEGLRALAEAYAGSIQAATDHCVERIAELSDARLAKMRGNQTPSSTRDGQSFVTLVWVLLVDGLMRYRQLQQSRDWLIGVIDATDLFDHALNADDLKTLVELFVQSIRFQEHVTSPAREVVTRTLLQVWAANSGIGGDTLRYMPLLDQVFVGRSADIEALHRRLGVGDKTNQHRLNIVRGWPGVGKTALINRITHDQAVRNSFADGLLWMSIGPDRNVFDELKKWGQPLGIPHIAKESDHTKILDDLRSVLHGRDICLIVDDVWTAEQGLYIKHIVDLQSNTLLMTTRFKDLSNKVKDIEDDIYVLNVLSEAHAIDLLRLIAPEPVGMYEARMPQLVKAMEGLPLALRVAGPTMQHYYDVGFNIDELLDEFENDYNRLLKSDAPGDRFDERTGKTPTIELLFKRSVETLPSEAQKAFAMLGVFKEKPATFSMDALQSVWEVTDPKPLIFTLTGRGLMDTTLEKRYWVHQTLHMYANKLLDDYDDEDGSS